MKIELEIPDSFIENAIVDELELDNILRLVKSKKTIYLNEMRKIVNEFEKKLFSFPSYNTEVYKLYIK